MCHLKLRKVLTLNLMKTYHGEYLRSVILLVKRNLATKKDSKKAKSKVQLSKKCEPSMRKTLV